MTFRTNSPPPQPQYDRFIEWLADRAELDTYELHVIIANLLADYEAEKARADEAVKVAKELSEWIGKTISRAAYEQEELGNEKAWEPLADAMFNGFLASYRDEIDALSATARTEG